MRHNARYIYWHEEAEKLQIDWDTWNVLIEMLEKEGHKVPDTPGCHTVRMLWAKDKSYRIDENAKDPIVYVSEVKEGRQELTIYFTYLDAEKAKRPKGAGSAGFNLVRKIFLNQYGLTMAQAYGDKQIKEDREPLFHKCASRVKYAIYLKKAIKGYKFKKMYKADISSAWPTELCDNLPDGNDFQDLPGRVAPTKEYPIAYYVKSGHIAEYEKYDTHDWKDDVWYSEIEQQSKENFKPHKGHSKWETFETIPDEEERTILFAKSKYSLRRAIEKIYADKEDKSDIFKSLWSKAMLNSFIGFMRSVEWNKQHYMGHISALAYARATHRMITMAKSLTKEGNAPIYMAIDSIIWIGHKSSLTSEKCLGAFVSEAEDAEGVIVNHGQYCLEKDGNIIMERHQGIDDLTYEEMDIDSLDEYIDCMNTPTQLKTVYDNEKHKFITRRVMNV